MRPETNIHRPPGQLAKAEQLAGVYRPIADPQAQADAIADVIKPQIAALLADYRAPRPEPTAREAAMLKACEDVGKAVDRFVAAKQTPGERDAWLNLHRATNRLRSLRQDGEAGHGSR